MARIRMWPAPHAPERGHAEAAHRHEHPILSLQRTAGNVAVTGAVQRKGAAISGPIGAYAPSTAKGIAAVQVALKVPATGTWDDVTSRALVDLKEGSYGDRSGPVINYATVSMLVTELSLRGPREAIDLVIDAFNFKVPPGTTFEYVAKDLDDGGDCLAANPKARPIRGPSEIRIGQNAFSTTEAFVHTVRHELEHAEQNANPFRELKGGAQRSPEELDGLEEFQGEATEIISAGMQPESNMGFAADAARAIAKWEAMHPEDRKRLRATFLQARKIVMARLADGPLAARWAAAA